MSAAVDIVAPPIAAEAALTSPVISASPPIVVLPPIDIAPTITPVAALTSPVISTSPLAIT